MVKLRIFKKVLDFFRRSTEAKLEKERKKLERARKSYNKLLEQNSETHKKLSSEKEKQIPEAKDRDSIQNISKEQTKKEPQQREIEEVKNEEEMNLNNLFEGTPSSAHSSIKRYYFIRSSMLSHLI